MIAEGLGNGNNRHTEVACNVFHFDTHTPNYTHPNPGFAAGWGEKLLIGKRL